MEKGRVEKLVSEIASAFGPEKIILFGSHARADARPDSDVDLLVVMRTRQSTLRTAIQIRQAVRHDFPIDIIVRTPSQIRDRLRWRDSFITEIMKTGKVVYEAAG